MIIFHNSSHMLFGWRRFLGIFAGVALMTGCGGSEEPYTSTDLESAYQAIAQGMSYPLVREVVGAEPVAQTEDGKNARLYRWESGRGTYLFSTLVVRIEQEQGVLAKSITGPTLSETDTFNAKE